MRATVFTGTRSVELQEVPDPRLVEPTDVVVRVVAACVCGSDLWHYRGETSKAPGTRIGHEMVATVEQVGDDVRTLAVGDLVVAPFLISDGTCAHCRAGMPAACVDLRSWGAGDIDACQGDAARVPLADGTLVPVPGMNGTVPDDALLRSLLTLSDVMGTGHHAAVSAGVRPGSTVAVVGDGAVGLCGVLAASRLGAGRIIALSRHADRQALARRLGATEIVAVRGEDAVTAVLEATDGIGADAVLECVGTEQSMTTAFAVARPGSTVGFVGVPHGVQVPIGQMFSRNIGLAGGMAPTRAYLPELLDDVLAGRIDPGLVMDDVLPLADVAEAYRRMDERESIKVMLRP